MDLTRKRVLVTGGAGFLGSHLCERLLRDGHDVLCVDNYFTGRKDNIAHLLGRPALRGDAARRHLPALRRGRRDLQSRLPGLAGALPARPGADHQDQRASARSTCSASPSGSSARILQASTSEVYGDPTVHPQTEDYWGNVNPIGPRACYDEGKRCAETLFFDYHRQHRRARSRSRGSSTPTARGCTRTTAGWSPTSSSRRCAARPSRSIGDGSQTRSFCYVDDLIDGFVRMMATDEDVTGPINLGNPHEIPMRELAERVIALTGSRSQHRVIGRCPQDDPLQRCPDIARARSYARLGADAWSSTRDCSTPSPISTRC